MKSSERRAKDRPISEGYLAGGAALTVTILWLFFSTLHPLIIFTLYVIALFCLSLSTLWLFSKEKTIKEWLTARPMRSYIVVIIEVFFIVIFLLLTLL